VQHEPGDDRDVVVPGELLAQLMQAEGGLTIERLSGTRATTTFRKLPIARPGANAKAAIAKLTRSGGG